MALYISRELIAKGKVERGWLGVSVQDVSYDLSKTMGVEGTRGALVSEVLKASPAEKAGLKQGDVIIAFNGKEIRDASQLRNEAASSPIGKEVKVTILREGKKAEVPVRIESMETRIQATTVPIRERLGVSVRPATAKESSRLKLRPGQGVVITRVEAGSPGAKADLEPGDVILEVNEIALSNAQDLSGALAPVKPGQQIHNTGGKTTLVASLLYAAGATTRAGRIEGGTCPTDFDGEEIDRKMSINLACAHVVHRDIRINFLDAPGYGIFAPEARAAVYRADAGLIVLDAVSGVEVQTERVWKFAAEFGRPVMFVVNRMDRERASFERTLESLTRAFGRGVVPMAIPLGEEKDFKGIVDLVRGKAELHADDGSGRTEQAEPPAGVQEAMREARDKLVEMVAETDEQLLEAFFEKGTLEAAELARGLRQAIRRRSRSS